MHKSGGTIRPSGMMGQLLVSPRGVTVRVKNIPSHVVANFRIYVYLPSDFNPMEDNKLVSLEAMLVRNSDPVSE